MSTAPVLLCYDGSDAAAHAIAKSGPLLGGGDALVVHVWRPVSATLLRNPLVGAPQGALGEAAAEIDAVAAEAASRVAADGAEKARAAGFDAEPLPVRDEGKEWQAIVALAEDRSARAVVVGPRGHSRLDALALGSVSHGLLHHARCPVIVVPVPGARDREDE